MNQEKLISFVTRKRAFFNSRDKIAQELAERFAMDYTQARRFIRYVEVKHARRIAAAQLPIVLVIGIPSFLFGVGIVAGFALRASKGDISVKGIYYLPLGLGLTIGSLWGIFLVVYKMFRG